MISFYFNPSHILNIWRKISATPIAKPKKLIAYNSGDIFYQKEGILTLVLRLLKPTALQNCLTNKVACSPDYGIKHFLSRS